jgi:predicted nuclease of predicted toxin-antitoxin system
MKFLFDQNLSFRLVNALRDLYPGSVHVRAVGLTTADDITVWDYAKSNDLMIVSKDSDFYQRSILFGHPPKVIWIRRGNCSTNDIEQILRDHFADIEAFSNDIISSCLELL